MKRKTHEEYIEEVKNINPDLEITTFYINATIKIKYKCKKCNFEDYILPRYLLKPFKCKGCKIKQKIAENNPPLEKLLKEIEEKYPNKFEYIGSYVNKSTKCWWRCKTCNILFKMTPKDILKGRDCPKCSIKKRKQNNPKPLNEVLEQIKKIWGDLIEYIGGYVNTHTKCKWKCKIDGYVWEAYPKTILNGHGCPECANVIKRKVRISLEELLKRVKNVWGSLIEYIDEYKGMHEKCKWKCTVCEHEWYARPYDILYGKGCPLCAKNSMEKLVLDSLKKKGIEPIHDEGLEGCYYNESKYPLRPDFIIKTKNGNLCIETDGKQHFYPIHGEEMLKIQQERDKYKNKYLKEHGFILIRVTSSPTKEWGFKNHITLAELLYLIEIGIDENGNVNLEMFRPYDFNRD